MRISHIKTINYYDEHLKIDFSKLKVGDVIVLTSVSYSVSGSYQYPDYNTFQLNKITEVGENYVRVGNAKYKQDYENRYIDDTKEVCYLNRLKVARKPSHIEPDVEPHTYYSGRQTDETSGIYSPSYLFLYTDEWKKRVERNIQARKEYEEKELEKERKRQADLDMRKEAQEGYDAVVNPLVQELEQLQQKLFETKKQAFENHFCKTCKSNKKGLYCAYELKWHSGYYSHPIVDSEKHLDSEGNYTRPIEKCDEYKKNA